jgi:hypothetical protein
MSEVKNGLKRRYLGLERRRELLHFILDGKRSLLEKSGEYWVFATPTMIQKQPKMLV